MIGRRRWGQVSGEDAKSSGQRAAEERAAVTSCWLGQDRWDNQRGRGPGQVPQSLPCSRPQRLGPRLAPRPAQTRPAGRTTSGRQSLKSSINEGRFFCVHLRHTRRWRRLCKASTQPHHTLQPRALKCSFSTIFADLFPEEIFLATFSLQMHALKHYFIFDTSFVTFYLIILTLMFIPIYELLFLLLFPGFLNKLLDSLFMWNAPADWNKLQIELHYLITSYFQASQSFFSDLFLLSTCMFMGGLSDYYVFLLHDVCWLGRI